MKKSIYLVLIGFVAFVLAAGAFASTEQERIIQYSLTAIDDVVTMRNWVGDVDGNWSTNVAQAFVGGVARSTINLDWGPAYYNASSSWEDDRGYQVFSSYGSVKKIESGMNYMDFPMYLSTWRHLLFKLPPGVSTDSGVWANGNRAYSEGNRLWGTFVQNPWNITNLNVLIEGQGQWNVGVGPTFDYGGVIPLRASDMDPSVTSPSQAFGISYIGELSNPAEQVVFVSEVKYDQTLGGNVLVCVNSLHKQYGSFKVMVTLQNYDENLGNTVQYFSRYVEVTDGVFMIPLIGNNGQQQWIQEGTYVRFIYEDPSDGGVVKQQYDFKLYYDYGGKGM